MYRSQDSLNSIDGCEGLKMHGFGAADFVDGRYYLYQNGRLRCGMVNLQIYTTDVGPGDGGLVLVPGSHKVRACLPSAPMAPRLSSASAASTASICVPSIAHGRQANLYPTDEMLELEEDSEITYSPVLSAGDAVLFSE